MAFNKNQIKKILYKEKPIASKVFFKGAGGAAEISDIYETTTSVGKFRFIIPIADRPANLQIDEPAQLLIRWLEIQE